jgi:hypothetical protein
MTQIGDQHGITAFIDWLQAQPNMPQRGSGYDPAKPGTWPWPERLERTLNILRCANDGVEYVPPATVPPETEQPEPEPPDPTAPVAFESGVFVAGGAGSNMGDPTGNGDGGSDYNGRPWTPDQACDAFVRSGYRSVLVQLYRTQGGDYMNAGRARGLKVGLWDAWPSADRARLALSFGPDAYCAQAETGQGQAAKDAIGAAYDMNPNLPLAIVTNLEPSRSGNPPDFDQFCIDRNVICMVEAYSNDNVDWQHDPHGLVDALMSEAYNRGYVNVIPVLGLYYGWTVSQYQMGGDPYHSYLAETMTHGDLA